MSSAKLRWRGRARVVRWSHEHWKPAASPDAPGPTREVDMVLELHPTENGGCILAMTPDGCFTADDWYASEREALDAARELLGVPTSAWTPMD